MYKLTADEKGRKGVEETIRQLEEEFGFEQFKITSSLGECKEEIKIEAKFEKKEDQLKIEETRRNVTIKGNDFTYVIDKITGLFEKIQYRGKDYLANGMNYCIYRACTDNDMKARIRWDELQLAEINSKQYTFEVKKVRDGIKVNAHIGLGAQVYCMICDIHQEIKIGKHGEISIKAQVEVGDIKCSLPRFGIHFSLDPEFSKVRYYGYGPNESYIDKRQSSYKGIFEDNVQDMFVDYIMPQENSSHDECSWIEIMTE